MTLRHMSCLEKNINICQNVIPTMRLITLRLERILKELIQKLADDAQKSLSEIVRDLIDLGIGYHQEAPITMQGAFGISRSFSKLSYGDEGTRMSLYLEKEQIEAVVGTFENTENGSIREAIRLGFIMLHADSVKFKNPYAEIQPFIAFKIKNLKNHRAQKAQENLRKIKQVYNNRQTV